MCLRALLANVDLLDHFWIIKFQFRALRSAALPVLINSIEALTAVLTPQAMADCYVLLMA